MFHKRLYTCPKCQEVIKTGNDLDCISTCNRYCKKCKVKFIVTGECGMCGQYSEKLTYCKYCKDYECEDCHYSCAMTR